LFRRLNWRSRRLAIAGLTLAAAALLLWVGVYGVLLGGFGGDGGDAGDDGGASIVATTPTPPPELSSAPGPPSTRGAPPSNAVQSTASSGVLAGRIVIESIGVNAPVIILSLDSANFPQVPNGPNDVAWYDFGKRPGQGGNAVFSGHVSWTVDGKAVAAVFWPMKDVKAGDVIKVALEDGVEYQYKVTMNKAVPWDDPNGVSWMYDTPDEVVTLITCGGTWVADSSQALGGNYTHRVIVRAERVG
jgi:LPXTG-site transpeptidase (sortase) family protein